MNQHEIQEEKKKIISRIMEFKTRNCYGRQLYYPANQLAKDALAIFKQRNKNIAFTSKQVSFFKFLGANVKLLGFDEDNVLE